MKLFTLTYRRKIRATNYDKKKLVYETAKVLKLFFEAHINSIDDKIYFFNQFPLFKRRFFMTHLDLIEKGSFEIKKLSNNKIQLIYQFSFGRFGYPSTILLFAIALISRNITSIKTTFVIIGIFYLLIIISQLYIFWEIKNSIKIDIEDQNAL